MSGISTDEKQDTLAEILWLLSEQEQSLGEILATGDKCEYALRAKRINELLEKIA